ncbi:MAG TPA: hypothetical protein VKU00_24745, partial [Chthonomonadaceae bacterium]|nr:hypothetical protein [Chthonomonadaceae bacterium]
MTMHPENDPRRVALIKSLATNNRFYALIDPERGIRNADTVAHIPDDLLLGIAYPCLEDGLNDFAVIRTTFETLDLFPEDDPIREEMMEIVHDARSNLLRRLNELHDKIQHNRAHFLGTDYNEFKSYAMDIIKRGYPRRNLDSLMKLNVFCSVAEAEGHQDTTTLLYYLQFAYMKSEGLAEMPPREFIVSLFDEIIYSVRDDKNYSGKYQFDKHVFQKFIAVMFVNYATTDPMFYGINRNDYGVSADKNMDSTPLYVAIRRELTAIELRQQDERTPLLSAPVLATPDAISGEPDFSLAAPLPEGAVPDPMAGITLPEHAGRVSFEEAAVMLPGELVNEEVLLGPITSLCSA